jgi:CHAD domain-containing protein
MIYNNLYVTSALREGADSAPTARTHLATESGKKRERAERTEPPEPPLINLIYEYLGRMVRVVRKEHPVALEGADPEGVHQMRVAIRRTRSVLKMFRDMLPDAETVKLDSELRWLARTLGHVRDADVYGETFRRNVETLPDKERAALEPYGQYLREAADEARRQLHVALTGERWEKLLRQFEQFVEAGPSTAYLRRYGGRSVAEDADRHVHRMVRKVIKRGRRIGPDSPPEALHRLRIDGKRLRYLLEFFSSASPERWRPLLKATKRLQDVLGEHQDACVARERITQYANEVPASDHDARSSFVALGRLLQIEEDRMIRNRARFAKAWEHFEKRCR